ncbi:TetR/AcrR family transcriptional regulator [Pseudosulfitobacter koreensis]|uniref:TetR/AcrR family transcriptional regulator n=1 Tax=Pseudosulfitobacter koreensis TaxID=2968472 RepID=A0ABT1YYC4_9RHOB|nr:TetR/AcrR family transcriptional regulator [Pseudosulfitobacter koreense]MCR8825846.1 TetR/AcrR family transcriptional regulator [Pseudosulfitobacter koreense]
MAAVTVALRDGFDQMTTEAIATEAGISTRTFFNYYNNKQAAILGEAVRLDVAGAGWFASSEGALTDDLARLMGQGLKDNPLDRAVLRKIISVIDANPALQDLFRTKVDETSLSLATLLDARLGPDMASETRLLAELATHALTEAVMIWAMDDAMTLDDITPLISAKLRNVGKILMQGDARV